MVICIIFWIVFFAFFIGIFILEELNSNSLNSTLEEREKKHIINDIISTGYEEDLFFLVFETLKKEFKDLNFKKDKKNKILVIYKDNVIGINLNLNFENHNFYFDIHSSLKKEDYQFLINKIKLLENNFNKSLISEIKELENEFN